MKKIYPSKNNNNTIFIIVIFYCSIFKVSESKYQLVWSDDFNGNRLDNDKWYPLIDCSGRGNHELQCYTERAQNVKVSNGSLILNAIPENYSNREFTSGRVHAKGNGWLYGIFQARARLPKGKHLWPAIWMVPSIGVYGPWPKSGEIDIMEARGQKSDTIEGTIHYGYSREIRGKLGSGPLMYPFDFSDKFHTFSFEWTNKSMSWYIDGRKFHSINTDRMFLPPATSSYTPSPMLKSMNQNIPEKSMNFAPKYDHFDTKFENFGNLKNAGNLNIEENFSDKKISDNESYKRGIYTKRQQPFDQPFKWILNVAVGGGYFPRSIYGDITVEDAKKSWEKSFMEIDWIKVYQDIPGKKNLNLRKKIVTRKPTVATSTTIVNKEKFTTKIFDQKLTTKEIILGNEIFSESKNVSKNIDTNDIQTSPMVTTTTVSNVSTMEMDTSSTNNIETFSYQPFSNFSANFSNVSSTITPENLSTIPITSVDMSTTQKSFPEKFPNLTTTTETIGTTTSNPITTTSKPLESTSKSVVIKFLSTSQFTTTPIPFTNPVTNSVTNSITNSATNPVMNLVTNPITNLVTNPITNPTTNPTTKYATTEETTVSLTPVYIPEEKVFSTQKIPISSNFSLISNQSESVISESTNQIITKRIMTTTEMTPITGSTSEISTENNPTEKMSTTETSTESIPTAVEKMSKNVSTTETTTESIPTSTLPMTTGPRVTRTTTEKIPTTRTMTEKIPTTETSTEKIPIISMTTESSGNNSWTRFVKPLNISEIRKFYPNRTPTVSVNYTISSISSVTKPVEIIQNFTNVNTGTSPSKIVTNSDTEEGTDEYFNDNENDDDNTKITPVSEPPSGEGKKQIDKSINDSKEKIIVVTVDGDKITIDDKNSHRVIGNNKDGTTGGDNDDDRGTISLDGVISSDSEGGFVVTSSGGADGTNDQRTPPNVEYVYYYYEDETGKRAPVVSSSAPVPMIDYSDYL